jgi:hypothetical protein
MATAIIQSEINIDGMNRNSIPFGLRLSKALKPFMFRQAQHERLHTLLVPNL